MAPARTAFVTGAASGLARGIVIDLARAGYRVAFTYRPGGTDPEETVAAVVAAGAEPPFAIPADHEVGGETARSAAAAQVALGSIAAYVHAVGPIVVKKFADSSMDDYHKMVAGNFQSAVEGAFAVLPGMREQRFGRVVYFGMNGSTMTLPAQSMSIYGGAKAAVVAFARTLALEEAKAGITVNVIQPGDIRDKNADRAAAAKIDAPGNPTGHAGSWEDIAYAVRFLLASEAGFINGQTIAVSGGLVEAYE